METTTEPLTSTKASKRHYDAIVVGGGHNGLVCAAYLAKAGKDLGNTVRIATLMRLRALEPSRAVPAH